MSNRLKKNGFLLQVTRFFTRPDKDAYELIHFRTPEASGDETWPALEAPDNWSNEAIAALADDAALQAVPHQLKPIEENTVPSWLWRHSGSEGGKGAEISVKQIFDRVVGAAAYAGWQKLFANENTARAFYDETRYMLAQRFIALDPAVITTLGVDWAYGLPKPRAVEAPLSPAALEISNATIDAVIGGSRDKNIQTLWHKATRASAEPLTLRFADIANDWGTPPLQPMRAALDLMMFRHNDGAVNVEALRHAVRLLVILLDLHAAPEAARAIGFVNLAPLLMALALPYDSPAGRALAAALGAFIGAEVYAASAELAGMRGATQIDNERFETILRAMRNHRRAAYGEHNDYEKVSVLPASLALNACPDLALAAAARETWDEALALTRRHGLRSPPVTTLSPAPALAYFMESAAAGLAPLPALTTLQPSDGETFTRVIAAPVLEGLSRLGYDQTQSRAIAAHIAGAHKLDKAPGINHAALRAKKFTAAVIAQVEDYLPQAGDIRVAFTPWIAGEDFCRDTLKTPAAKLSAPRFDLLKEIGFTEQEIAAANLFVYGHGSAQGAKDLKAKHACVFAYGEEISAEARIRMAASVQSFLAGDAGLALPLAATEAHEKVEKLLLMAWKQGIKSAEIYESRAPRVTAAEAKKAVKQSRRAALFHTKPPAFPPRGAKLKAKAGIANIARARGKGSRKGSHH